MFSTRHKYEVLFPPRSKDFTANRAIRNIKLNEPARIAIIYYGKPGGWPGKGSGWR